MVENKMSTEGTFQMFQMLAHKTTLSKQCLEFKLILLNPLLKHV